jgi:hypothetical protein
MKLAVDPGQAMISANIQLVLVPRQGYQDSICFTLNPELEIQALTAQELIHYEFKSRARDNLVLYIQEPILAGEQINIALAYKGRIDDAPIHKMDTSLYWYPRNPDTSPSTIRAKFALPGNWQIGDPPMGMGKHGKWLYENREPQSPLNVIFTAR